MKGLVRDRQVTVVRISPAVEEDAGADAGSIPSLTSRVVVTAILEQPVWAEWRYRVGRDLAEVVERCRPRDRTQVTNAEIVPQGLAQVMTIPLNLRYREILLALQREAREAGRGLWGRA